MEEKLLKNITISIDRELYQIWERVFIGYRDENLEKELFAYQAKHGNIDWDDLNINEDVQDCFGAGLRVFDALSPYLLRLREETKEHYEKKIQHLESKLKGDPPS